MSIFRRNPRRLPGTLCDETPAADADLMVPLKDRGRWFRPLTPEQIAPYASFASAIGNGVAVPRIPVHEVPEPRDDSEYDQAAAETADRVAELMPAISDEELPPMLLLARMRQRLAYVDHTLREVAAARDQLDAANGLLVAKVRELREQLGASR